MTYVDCRLFLHSLLLAEDRISMAHSIEDRVPFLDNRIVDLALQLDGEHKIQGAFTKKFVKNNLAGLLSDEIIHHKKMGFPVPGEIWTDENLRTYVTALLLSPRCRSRGFFSEKAIRKLLANPDEMRRNGFLLFQLISIELWFCMFIDHNIPNKDEASILTQSG